MPKSLRPVGLLVCTAIALAVGPSTASPASDAGLTFAPAASQAPDLGSLSAGPDHACAVRTDGTIACWGDDAYGKATPPSGEFIQVSAGVHHTCALRTDGVLSCWGSDGFGQAPAVRPGPFTQVSAGGFFSCGLRTDGTLECWGDDSYFQSTPPVGSFTQVAAGASHACGLASDGALTCWGNNTSGQAPSAPPDTFTQVVAAADQPFTCAVRTQGTIVCWGDNAYDRATPPAGAFTQIALGSQHGCGLQTDGAIGCWGDNGLGQTSPPADTFTQLTAWNSGSCGLRTDGTLACWGQTVGTAPPGTFSRRQLQAGGGEGSGEPFTCGLRTDGTLACWGGVVSPGPPSGTFTQISARSGACALRTDGSVVCWPQPGPSGTFTQIAQSGTMSGCGVQGEGTIACWGTPAYGETTAPPGTFTRISGGNGFFCGIRTDGTLACWGKADAGQTTPAEGKFVQVSAGADHACALTANGAIACWGLGSWGQTNAPSGTFTLVTSGWYHSCGIRTDGTVACWGSDYYGQGADDPPSGSFTSLTAGHAHTCGLRTDGALACWGQDDYGQAPRLSASPSPVLEAARDVAYSQILTLSGGAPAAAPFTLTVVSGNLPQGLSLTSTSDTTYELTGTPTTLGIQDFTLRISDSNPDFPMWNDQAFTLRVQCDSATAITSVLPEPSTPGQPATVAVSVTSSCAAPMPTGTVSVSDGTNACVVTLPETSCQITWPAPGTSDLFATYSGDATFASSSSAVTIHTIAPSPTLTVTKTGNGGGGVTSDPAGLNCGATCEATYDAGTVVTLTAAPDGLSAFGGWTGGGCFGTGSCEVTLDQSKEVTATFNQVAYALTVLKGGRGGGTVSSAPEGISCGQQCVGAFGPGTVVALTATPDGNSRFGEWGGVCSGTSPTCDVPMNGVSGPVVPRAGLVAEWLFDGNAADTSGNANHGLVSGAVSTADRFGRAGRAFAFDGTSFISGSADGLPTADRTISLWFKATSLDRPTLLGYGGGECGTSAFIGINQASGAENAFQFQGHCEVDRLVAPYGSAPVGAWHHLVFATDGTGTRFYLDGGLLGSNATHVVNTHVAGTQFALGSATSPGGSAPYTDWALQNLVGALDDVRIYDRGLTGAEVAALWLESGSELAVATFLSTIEAEISGTVTDATTLAPLAGVQIEVFDAGGQHLQSATTDASGRYLLHLLTGGTFYLRTRSGLAYADEQYDDVACPNGSCDPAGGTPVALAGGSTLAGIDFALNLSGSISGTVMGGGAPLVGVQMRAADASGRHVAWTSTDGAGVYYLSGLGAGSYYVATANSSGYVDQVYQNVTCPSSWCDWRIGTAIVVTAGAHHSDIDFTLAPGGSISGTVTAGLGGPGLSGVEVKASSALNQHLSGAVTDGAGAFVMNGLPAGDHYVLTWNTAGYIDELYDDVGCPGAACTPFSDQGAKVSVVANETHGGIVVALSPGASITGTVTAEISGAPLSGVPIEFFDTTGRYVGGASSNPSGVYASPGLPEGSYYLRTRNGIGYVDELHNGLACPNGSCDPRSGAEVPVAVGSPATVDFALAQGGSMAGTVTAEGGGGLGGVSIGAQTASGPWLAWATTSASGGYLLTGLPAGSYYVLTSGAPGHLDQLYQGVLCPNGNCQPYSTSGTPVVVMPPATTGAIDFALGQSGSISGTVTGDGGVPLSGVQVRFFTSSGQHAGDAWTGTLGTYTSAGLVAGTYYVRTRNEQGYLDELYDNLPCPYGSCDPRSGSGITVDLGATATVHFQLTSGTSISGMVTSEGGGGLAGVWVGVQTESGGPWLAGTTTNPAGAYVLSGLPDGSFYVLTSNTPGHVDELYDNVPCPGQACQPYASQGTAVSATILYPATGINFALSPGATISGSVTAEGDTALGDVAVKFFDASGQYRGEVRTDASGTYASPGLADGTYYVRTRNWLSYVDELYDNLPCPNESCDPRSGGPMAVTVGAPASNIDFILGLGGSISGVVTDAVTGSPLSNVYVDIQDSSGNGVGGGNTNAVGVYKASGLPGGTYYARASWSSYVCEFYDNVPCGSGDPVTAGAMPIVVNPMATAAGIDFALTHGVSISGRVTGADTQAPLTNVTVVVIDDLLRTVAWLGVNDNGEYTSTGLAPGTYRVFVIPSGGSGYIGEVYDDVQWLDWPWGARGTRLTLAAGETRSSIDFALGKGATIHGRITTVTGEGVGNTVSVGPAKGWNFQTTVTDENGDFTLTGVPAGSYFELNARGHHYLGGCWGGGPSESYTGPRHPACTGFTVAEGQVLGPLNISLEAYSSHGVRKLAGIVTDAATQAPLGNVTVSVFDRNGTPVAKGTTQADGTYFTREDLIPGLYYLRADNAAGHLSQCYGGVPCPYLPDNRHLAAGNPVMVLRVPSPGTLGGHDFALTTGGRIAGRITDATTGGPLAAEAIVYDDQGHVVARATADDQGQYTTVPDVPEGTYFVVARGAGHLPRLYGGATAPECSIDPPNDPLTGYDCGPTGGDPVFVGIGDTVTGIDVTLEAGHFIGGAVLEDGSPFGVAGLSGFVYDASGTIVGTFGTDFTGGFLSSPVPEGTYYLRTFNWTGYIDEALGGEPCGQNCVPTFGTPVTVIGDAVPWVEFSLALGPRIVGTVRDAAGEVVAGRDVQVYDTAGVRVTTAVTARDGLYWTINGLAPGTYYARTVSHTGLEDQLYQGLPCAGACDPTTGTPIVIVDASDKTGIDFGVADPNPLPPAVSIGDATVNEGNLGDYPTVEIPVTLSRAYDQEVGLVWQTVSETAVSNDFGSASGTLSFPPGTVSLPVVLTIRGDRIHEPDETFAVRLNLTPNAMITDSDGRVTITDDDPVPTVSVVDTTLREGQSGTKTAFVVAHLSNPSATPVTVDYATADGTAQAAADYAANSGTLTFPGGAVAGGSSQAIEIAIEGDTTSEGDETFDVTLSNPSGATLDDAEATVTILDDEGLVEPPLEGNWQLAQEGVPAVYGAAWGNGQYLLAGTGGEIWTSSDGSSWQKHAADPQKRILRAAAWDGAGRYVAVGHFDAPDNLPAAVWSADGSTWHVGDTTQGAGFPLFGVAYGAGTFVAVGNGGRAFTSPDGLVWTMHNTSAFARLNAVAFGHGLFVAVANNHRVVTSPDGLTWTVYTPPGPSTLILNGVAWTGTQFVAVGGDSAGNLAQTILTSPDGITWTLSDALTRPLYAVAAGDGRIVAVGNFEPTAPTTGQGWTSSDGITWTALSLPAVTPGVYTGFRAVTFGGAGFLAAGTSGNVYVTDGTSDWSDRTLPASRAHNSVTHDGVRYCAVGATGLVATSIDGIQWTNRAPFDPAAYGWNAVIHANGQFLAVGNAIASSTDCVSWAQLDPAAPLVPGATTTLTKVAYGNGRYVAVGRDAAPGLPIVPRIRISSDGITWTDATPDLPAGNRAQFAAVAYGAGRFVAFAEDFQNGVHIHLNTSTNGITWTRQATPFFDENYEDVSELLYAGGQFVLATDRVWTSPDGLNWTLRKNYTDDYYRGLSYANDRYVAVGNGGGIATSSDGADWRSNVSPTGHDLTAVAHDSTTDRFVAVGISAVAYTGFAPVVGRISGSVTDAMTSAPLVDATVEISDSTGETVAWANTGPSGLYSADLPAGTYHARVQNVPGHLGELYRDLPCLGCNTAAGTPIPVTAGQTTASIDFTLTPGGGAISGRISDAVTGQGLGSAHVNVYTATGDLAGFGFADGDGNYSKPGLPAGTYYVQAWADSDYINEVYDDRQCPPACGITNGTPVVVTEGNITTSIDFALDIGGRISGTVSDAVSGAPLANADVQIFDASGDDEWWARTSETGVYDAGALTPGIYYAKVESVPGHLGELYQEIPCFNCDARTGTPITVTRGHDTVGIDFTLMPGGGAISGRVTDAANGQGLYPAHVGIHTATGTNVGWGFTDANGYYTKSGLPAGTYYASSGNYGGYINETYRDRKCPPDCGVTNGTPIPVTDGLTTTGIDFALDLGGSIAGRVTDAVSGVPLPNAMVEILTATGPFAGACHSEASGAYRTCGGLPPGTYYAKLEGVPGHLGELYQDLPCLGCDATGGTPITVTVGQTTSGIDFTLTPGGGAISGRITAEATGLPLTANVWVDVSTAAGVRIGSAHPEATGTYVFSGLPAGTYHARTNNSAGYVNLTYDGLPCPPTCNAQDGTPITVVGGVTTTGIDFALDKAGTIAGHVTEEGSGAPLSVTVWIWDETGNIVQWFSSNVNGDYSRSLPPGQYRVVAGWGAPDHVSEIYDNIQFTNWPWGLTGTPVTVAREVTSQVDFQLSRVGRISGTVTDADTGQPVPGQDVCIWHGWGFKCGVTNTDGIYTITGLPAGQYPVFVNGKSGYGILYYDGSEGVPAYGGFLPQGAADVPVSAGATTDSIDFGLHAGSRIEGTVRDEGTTDPVPNVTVNVYSEFGQLLMGGKSDANGHYVVGGLGPGTFYARTDNSDGYANECLGGTTCPGLPVPNVYESMGSSDFIAGTPVVLATGATALNVDFTLRKGGRISGRITNTQGQRIAGSVSVFDDARRKVATAFSDSLGNYVTAQGLPAGSYYVLAWGAQYVAKVYDNVTCLGCNPTTGSPVEVTLGVTAPGIDFVLARGGQIAGRVHDAATGKGFPVDVEVWNESGRVNADSMSSGDFTGGYVTNGLPAGTYFVRTRNWSGYMDEAYDGVLCAQACTPLGTAPVQVTEGTVTWDVDFDLARGALVTGTVTNSAGEPVAGTQGQIYDTSGRLVTHWGTGPLGRFLAINSLPPGTYYARTRNLNGYVDEVYSGLPCVGSCDLGAGTPIVVSGPDIGGIDFVLRPGLAVSDATVDESGGNATFTVTLSHGLSAPTTAQYATSDQTATEGSDYTATSGTLTFAPGETTKPILVPINDDNVIEADETFLLTLSSPALTLVVDGLGVGTITDDDNRLPGLSVGDASVAEGNASTAPLRFTVSLSNSSAQTVTVQYSAADGTAIVGSDYQAALGIVTFLPGQVAKVVTVRALGDRIYEGDETFLVNLSSPTNAALADGTGVGTILDDDPLPSLAISNASAAEGNSGTVAMSFTVALSAVSGQPATVEVTTADGTATAPIDYIALPPTTLTFAPGETAKIVEVTVNGDLDVEPDETFLAILSGPTGATLADTTGTGTITNDDILLPALSVGDASVAEGNASTAPLRFTVSLSSSSAQTVTVQYSAADGTAIMGSDYQAALGIVTFQPGQVAKVVTVRALGDRIYEGDETFLVNLSSPTNATLADGTGVGTILDDDPLPSLAIGNTSVTEGNSGTVAMSFTVTLSAVSGEPATVEVTTADGTAAAPIDYVALTPTTLTFTPGETAKTVEVTVNGDLDVEPGETLLAILSGPTGATLADATGTGTITNDDILLPALSVGDASVAEGNASTAPLRFTVSLSSSSVQTVTVQYSTTDGTAIVGSDYQAALGIVTFQPGQVAKVVTVRALGDRVHEGDETFLLNLSSPTNATLADGTGLGTILADDPLPSLAIGNTSVTEGNSGTVAMSFTVTLTAPSSELATVDVATTDGTATAPIDYVALPPTTLTFAPGETAKTVTLFVNGDGEQEPNETLFVNLTQPGGAFISVSRGIGTIRNDDR